MKNFKTECEAYSIDDLKLIIDTQKDLYNKDEMKCLIETLNEKREAAEIERINNLPKEIICPKCDMIFSISSEKCPFCEFNFKDTNDMYKYAVNKNENLENEDEDVTTETNSNIIAYIFSFLIPLVGFILGANLMSKDNENEKSQGIICIILGIISIIVSTVIVVTSFN